MNLGKVVKIQGGVVDVAFANAAPQIQELLYAGDIPLEVMLMRDQGVARCMALAPVRGLGLGTEVKATGAPIKVPVGEGVLGRMRSEETRLNSSHVRISYAVFCLKKKK